MKYTCSSPNVLQSVTYNVDSPQEAVLRFGFDFRLKEVEVILVDSGDPLTAQYVVWRISAHPLETEFECTLANRQCRTKIKANTVEGAIREYIHYGGPCEVNIHSAVYVTDKRAGMTCKVFVSTKEEGVLHLKVMKKEAGEE